MFLYQSRTRLSTFRLDPEFGPGDVTRERTRNVHAQGGTDRPSTSLARAIAYFAWCVLQYRLMDAVEQYPGKVCEEQTDDYDEDDEREGERERSSMWASRACDESVRDVDSLRG